MSGSILLRRALTAAVVLRLTFHALYLPAFEGPDEPQHLARALDFARRPFSSAFRGARVDADVVAATLTFPCPGRSVGCPPYSQVPGAFDLLRAPPPPAPAAAGARAILNVEANQPPLYYALAGLVLRGIGIANDPARALLALRLLNACLVLVAVLGPLRRVARHRPAGFAVAGLLALLAPGASEALVRCSNDAVVFLWSALVVAAVDRRASTPWIVVLAAAGPLLKMTAFAVVAFAVAALWSLGRRAGAAVATAASCSVFAVQALRGWRWGGTLELNLPGGAVAESPAGWLVGLVRSAYACVKTTLWLGGWSAFRPPVALVAAFALLLAVALGLGFRRRPPSWPLAHAAGLAVAAAGFFVFAVANRRLYGVWGGVGGWYLWGWAPWLAVSADDLLAWTRRQALVVLGAEGALVAAANALWLVTAQRLYL